MVPQITQSVMCIIAIGEQLKCMYIQDAVKIMKWGRYLFDRAILITNQGRFLCIHIQRTLMQYYTIYMNHNVLSSMLKLVVEADAEDFLIILICCDSFSTVVPLEK